MIGILKTSHPARVPPCSSRGWPKGGNHSIPLYMPFEQGMHILLSRMANDAWVSKVLASDRVDTHILRCECR